MAAGSIIGPYEIVLAIVQILKDHLADYLARVEAKLGITPGTIKPPSITDGITPSRIFGRDTRSAIAVYVGSGEPMGEARGWNFPERRYSNIRVKIQWGSTKAVATEQGLLAISRSVQAVVMERWRGYSRGLCWSNTETSSDEDGASYREQFQVQGIFSFGRQAINTNDQNEVTFRVTQSVESIYRPA